MKKPQLDFPPPLIYEVEANGGLGYDLVGPGAARDITIVIGPWDKFNDGDQARIHWGGNTGPVVGTRPMTVADNYQSIGIAIRASAINVQGPGVFDVVHENASAIGNPIFSPPYAVEVKLLVPGGFDPQPDTETINENLKPATVRPSPLGDDLSNVRVVVAKYDNLSVGDRITASWHGHPHTIVLSAADVGKTEFEVPIPEEDIRQVGGGVAKITYRILDRVTNSSKWAPYADIDVPIGDPGALPPPRVVETEADGKTVDLGKLGANDLTVQALNHDGLRNASITVTWNGTLADGTPRPPYSPPSKTLDYDYQVAEFSVPNAEAGALAGGTARVSYTRTNPGEAAANSRRRDLVFIGAGNPMLPPPSVQEAVGDVIPGDLPVAHLVIPALTVGDSVTAHIAASTPFSQTLKMTDPSNPPVFSLSGPSFIVPNAGRQVKATYTVTGPGYSATSDGYDFGITPVAGALPAPTVDEAAAGQIDPGAAASGVTVAIAPTALITPADDVAVTVSGPGGAETPAAVTGSASGMKIPLGPAVIGKNLGRAITVQYSVTPKAGGASRTSPPANFNVLDLNPDDPRVGKPVIAEALGGTVLDLNQFANDATVKVPRWPLMAAGQVYWLTANTAAGSQAIATAVPVAAPGQLTHPLARTWLNTLADQTILAILLEVAFDGGPQAGAKGFHSPTYTLKAKTGAPTFPAPSIPEEAPAGQLDGNLTAASLVVPASATLQPGDSVAATFGTHALGTQAATPGVAMTFAITAAMIVAERGSTVSSTYIVTRGGIALPASAAHTSIVSKGGEQWDFEFDFDGEPTRDVDSRPNGAQLHFDKVFNFMFDRDNLPTSTQYIGVKPLNATPPPLDDYFKNDILWIGHPTSDTLVDKVVLCELFEEWSEVRFAVSVMDDPVTVSFQDASRRPIGAIKTLNANGANTQHAEVRSDNVPGKRVKWIEIHCPDTIHLDYFKFRGRAPA